MIMTSTNYTVGSGGNDNLGDNNAKKKNKNYLERLKVHYGHYLIAYKMGGRQWNNHIIANSAQLIQYSAGGYQQRAYAHVGNGDLNKAIADLDAAIKDLPDVANLYEDRGAVYGEKGDFDKSIADLDKALQIKSDLADSYYYRSLAYLGKGDFKRAFTDCDKALKLQYLSSFTHTQLDAYLIRGFLYGRDGDLDKAITDFEAALRIKVENVCEGTIEVESIFHNNARECLEHARKEKEALEKLRKAAEQGDADAQYKLGMLYFEGDGVPQDFDKAAEWCLKAAAQGNKKAKEFLAEVEAAGEKEKARVAREAAERKAREAKEAAERKAREEKEAAERLRIAEEKKAREEKEAAERLRKVAVEKIMRPFWRIGLVLQLGVTAAFFFLFFSGSLENISWTFLGKTPSLLWALKILALLGGVPAVVIGIIALLFRKGAGAGAAAWLIILIDIVLFISMTISSARGFFGFIGYLILYVIIFSISAIPGFLMAAAAIGTELTEEKARKTKKGRIINLIAFAGVTGVLLFVFLPKILNTGTPPEGTPQSETPVKLGKLLPVFLFNIDTSPDVTFDPDLAQQYSDAPVKLGTWKLSYRQGKSKTEGPADLIIQTCKNNVFTGYFNWYDEKENYMGREYFKGRYDEQKRQVLIKGTRLEQKNSLNLVRGKYRARVSRVSDDRIKLTDGTMSSIGIWGILEKILSMKDTWEAEWVKDEW
jgi:tetratricopeptide (TPR) repeat protein